MAFPLPTTDLRTRFGLSSLLASLLVLALLAVLAQLRDGSQALRQATERERESLELSQTWMIGDREGDITTGLNAKVRVAAVCTGKHSAQEWAQLALPGLPVFPTLREFVETLT